MTAGVFGPELNESEEEAGEAGFEAVFERNAEIMEKIIRHHIGTGNNIITDRFW